MSPKEIEALKAALVNMVKTGCRVVNEGYGVDGKIVGVGFKPYWTSSADSKIEKLELNIMDKSGNIMPFYFHHVIGYDVLSFDGKRLEDSRNASLDIKIYSPNNTRDDEYSDKIHLEVASD